ncbi:MAG: hypothetical protein FWG90_05975 [Oscillospiraceae bacterium]|nr:hypothetical protein [Oscillospiraceae bacterium]
MKKLRHNEELFLMCKDISVFNISKGLIVNESLVPGSILRGTMNFDEWLHTRYSVGSNTSARRLMLRAFGSDNHTEDVIKATRALSLSDCYWIKGAGEDIAFNEITPYFNKEWDGNGLFKGGSVSTLFVNGAADKKWLDSKTLLKVKSFKEVEPYELCTELGIENIPKVERTKEGLLVTNFTSPEYFLESMQQSGFVQEDENPREKAVELFGEAVVILFVIDYLAEHDDRHWGNYGFMRNADTGEYKGMSPYYDFDWAWSGGVVQLPQNALKKYGGLINDICTKAKSAAGKFERGDIITRRADELSEILK